MKKFKFLTILAITASSIACASASNNSNPAEKFQFMADVIDLKEFTDKDGNTLLLSDTGSSSSAVCASDNNIKKGPWAALAAKRKEELKHSNPLNHNSSSRGLSPNHCVNECSSQQDDWMISPHYRVIERLKNQKTQLLELFADSNQRLIEHYSSFTKPLNDMMDKPAGSSQDSSRCSSPNMGAQQQQFALQEAQQQLFLALIQRNQQILLAEKQLRDTTK